MVLAQAILERLLAHESLKNNLHFDQIVRFLDFAHRIWQEITPPDKARPLILPSHVAQLLASILNLDTTLIQLMWSAFGDLAEVSYKAGSPPSLDDEFRIHAHSSKIGSRFLSSLVENG